jgi:hypothetical protein
MSAVQLIIWGKYLKLWNEIASANSNLYKELAFRNSAGRWFHSSALLYTKTNFQVGGMLLWQS